MKRIGILAAMALLLTPMQAQANQFLVYFDYGSSWPGERGISEARRVVEYARMFPPEGEPVYMYIIARSDSAEALEFGADVDIRRLRVMALAVEAQGFPAEHIRAFSCRDRVLARPTPPNTRDQLNRHILMEVVRGEENPVSTCDLVEL